MEEGMDIFGIDSPSLLDHVEIEDSDDAGLDLPEEKPEKVAKDIDKDDINGNEDNLIEIDDSTEDGEDIDEEPTKKPSPDKSVKDKPDEGQISIISSIVKDLQDEGILNLEEGREITNSEDFFDALEEEKQRYHEEQLEILPESMYKEALDAVRAGVPIERVIGSQARQEQYNSISDDDVQSETPEGAKLRENILMADFMSKGYNQTKAAKLAKRSIDAGDDIEDAIEALSGLKAAETASFNKAKEEAKAAQIKAEEARIQGLKDFKKYIDTTKEIIPGYRLSPKRKKELYDSMTKGVGVINGKQVDPLNKYLAENGTEGVAFLTEILLLTNYGKDKGAISAKKAHEKATRRIDKQLKESTGGGFAQEYSQFQQNPDDLWKFVD